MRRTSNRLAMTARLVSLIALVQSRRYQLPSLQELAAMHGCSQRTIRRDLEAIELVMPVPKVRAA